MAVITLTIKINVPDTAKLSAHTVADFLVDVLDKKLSAFPAGTVHVSTPDGLVSIGN